jgi:membrane protein
MPGQSEEKMAERRRSAGDFAHQARSAANTLFDRVARFDVRTLGWIGLLGLLWTAVSTLGTIEDSMNGIWHIEKPRSLVRQVWLYALVSVVLPLLVAVALSMPAMRGVKTVLDATVGATAYTRWAGDALTALFSSRLFGFVLSYLFSTLAFAFVLGFMPNTRVNRLAALEGGALTALFMGLWFKICAIAQVGISQAGMFYGSFAVFPIVLTWLYVSWRILLFGRILTYAFHRIHTDRSGALGPR